MSDQIQYTEGTWVWPKIMNKIWWPGKIVLKDKVLPIIDNYINLDYFFNNTKAYKIIQYHNIIIDSFQTMLPIL